MDGAKGHCANCAVPLDSPVQRLVWAERGAIRFEAGAPTVAFSVGGPLVRARYEAHACEALYSWLRESHREVNESTRERCKDSKRIWMQLHVIYFQHSLAEKRQSRPKSNSSYPFTSEACRPPSCTIHACIVLSILLCPLYSLCNTTSVRPSISCMIKNVTNGFRVFAQPQNPVSSEAKISRREQWVS